VYLKRKADFKGKCIRYEEWALFILRLLFDVFLASINILRVLFETYEIHAVYVPLCHFVRTLNCNSVGDN